MSYQSLTETPPPQQSMYDFLNDERRLAFPPVAAKAVQAGHRIYTQRKKKRCVVHTAASPRKVKKPRLFTTSLSLWSSRAPINLPSTCIDVRPTTTREEEEEDDDDDLFVLVPPSVLIHEREKCSGTLANPSHHSRKKTNTRSFLRPRPCFYGSSASHHHENPFRHDLPPAPTSRTTAHCHRLEGLASSTPLVTCDQGIVIFVNPSNASAATIRPDVHYPPQGSSSLWSLVSDIDAAADVGLNPSCTANTPVHPGVLLLPRASRQLDPTQFTHKIPSHLTLPSLFVYCSSSPPGNRKLPFLARRRTV
jgi:hypothetical protein